MAGCIADASGVSHRTNSISTDFLCLWRRDCRERSRHLEERNLLIDRLSSAHSGSAALSRQSTVELPSASAGALAGGQERQPAAVEEALAADAPDPEGGSGQEGAAEGSRLLPERRRSEAPLGAAGGGGS